MSGTKISPKKGVRPKTLMCKQTFKSRTYGHRTPRGVHLPPRPPPYSSIEVSPSAVYTTVEKNSWNKRQNLGSYRNLPTRTSCRTRIFPPCPADACLFLFLRGGAGFVLRRRRRRHADDVTQPSAANFFPALRRRGLESSR